MKIALLGDIALFGKFSVKNDYNNRLKTVAEILKDCDVVIANLETPLTNNNVTIGGRSAYIKGTPEDVEILKYLNVTHVTLANNHIFDYCEKGVEDTINTLEKNGISSFGVFGKNQIINENIILRGYCCFSTNGRCITEDESMINGLTYSKLVNNLEYDKAQKYLSILSIHWGIEHVHYPSIEHIKLIRQLSKSYNFIVHGHHPHVIQGYEISNNALINYSLGNFCFDDVYTSKSSRPLIKLSKDNKLTYIMVLKVEGNRIIEYKIIPVSFNDETYRLCQLSEIGIEQYSSFLGKELNVIEAERIKEFNDYITRHKKERNLEWYIKRLNFESIRIIYYELLSKNKYKTALKGFM